MVIRASYWTQLPPRPISTANESDPRNLIQSSEMTNNCMVLLFTVPLNCYKLKMKVRGPKFVSAFIEITQLMWHGKYAPSSCFCLFFNNSLECLISNPNGKCNLGETKNFNKTEEWRKL